VATRSSSNSPPRISGNPPPAIKTGDEYSFQPNVSDADADSLSFTVTNLPSWAEFDSISGKLSGQPLLGHEGIYEGILIIVSDGETSTSLAPFSITVTQTALGAVSLSWTPPLRNSDGSTLVDLSGYRIHYGVESRSYRQIIEIDNAGVTTYLVEYLVPATYFFTATAVNRHGHESSFSIEVVVQIQQ
jgi:hypothetical protein